MLTRINKMQVCLKGKKGDCIKQSPSYYVYGFELRLFALLHLSLELCESVEVTESCAGSYVVDNRSRLLLSCVVLARCLNLVLSCLECTAM